MKKTKTQREWEKKKRKKKKKPPSVKGKKKKKMKTPDPVKKRKRKKRGSKVATNSDRGTHYVVLITEMPLTELWKLKIPKMCFQFP